MYYITDLYTFLHMQSYAQHIIYHHRIKYYIKTIKYNFDNRKKHDKSFFLESF